jgi:ABC-type transport system involved in multi-copper enzyme maturation permease subunit
MKKESTKILIVSFFIGILFVLGFGLVKNLPSEFGQKTDSIQNVAQTYQTISGIDIKTDSGKGDLTNLLNTLFQWGIAAAVMLSVIFIILGSIQYMTTDAVFGKEEGKSKIMSAVGGLILALISFLILNTINPELTKINIDPEELGDDVGKGVEGGGIKGAQEGGATKVNELRNTKIK